MSCDVGPGSLATTSTPSSGTLSANCRGEHPAGHGQHRLDGLVDGQVERRSGCPRMAAAAETPGQRGGVLATLLGTHADLGALTGLAEEDHQLGRRRLAEQVAQAFGIGDGGTAGGVVDS